MTLAGSDPARRFRARSEASSWVPTFSMTPLSLIWPLMLGAVITLPSSTIASRSPMCEPVKVENRLRRRLAEDKRGLPSSVLALLRAGILNVLATNDWGPREQVPGFVAGAAAMHQLGANRQHAAILRQRFFAAWKRTALHFIQLQHSGRLEDLLHAAGSSTPGQLHQQFGIGIGAPLLDG